MEMKVKLIPQQSSWKSRDGEKKYSYDHFLMVHEENNLPIALLDTEELWDKGQSNKIYYKVRDGEIVHVSLDWNLLYNDPLYD